MMQIPDSNENSNSNETRKSINQKGLCREAFPLFHRVGLIIAGEVVKDLIGYENR